MFEDKSKCTCLCERPVLNNKCAIYHFTAKSKEYYIFNKLGRLWNIEKFKTPLVNQHVENKSNFKDEYYSLLTKWEHYNSLEFNCVEDLTLKKFAPLIRERICVPPRLTFTPLIDIKQYIQSSSGLQRYYRDNLSAFKNQSMSLGFHYWFIFDERNLAKINLISSKTISDSLDLSHYNTSEFISHIASEVNYCPLSVALFYYVSYEMGIPC